MFSLFKSIFFTAVLLIAIPMAAKAEWVTGDDPGGLLRERTEFRADSSIRFRETLVYNHAGQVIEKRQYHYKRNGLKWLAIYEYDDLGRVTRIATYNSAGQLKSESVFTYLPEGEVIPLPQD